MKNIQNCLFSSESVQERKNAIFRGCNMGFWQIVLNPETQEAEMYADDIMFQLLGLSENISPEKCYTHWFSHIVEEEVPFVMKAVGAILESGLHHEIEYWWNHPKLGRIPVRCGGKRINKGDNLIWLEGYHKNLYDVHQMHTSLRNSLARIQTIFETAPFAFALRNNEYNIVECNPEFLKLFNINSSENLPRDLTAFYPESQPCGMLSAEKFQQQFQGALKEELIQVEWLYILKNGQELPTEITIKRIEFGGETYFLHFIRDLREQKRLIQALEQQHHDLEIALVAAGEASRSKNLFFANISHEIRTPMNAIMGMSYLCLQQTKEPQILYYLENIQTAGKNLLNIINDVLDISKIEAGKLELEHRPFNLSTMLENLCGTLCSLTATKPVEVLFNVDPTLPNSFIGDSTRLGQVLTNLLSNANKFTEKGYLLLHVHAKNTHGNIYTIGIDVADTGIGMDANCLEAIFRPFEQEDQTTTRRFGGTGLGLTISKNIVELMGGSISVRSELGKGTTFSFEINLLSQKEVSWLDTSLAKRIRILVLDDTPMACEVLKNMLELCGFWVDTVENTREACSMLLQAEAENSPYRLVITDWNMPDMDGYQSAKTMQNLQLQTKPAFLLTSAYGSKLLNEENKELFSSFIPKPILPISLWSSVMNALNITIKEQLQTNIVEETANYDTLQGKNILLVEDNIINQEIATALLEDLKMNIHVAENGQRALEIVQTVPLHIVLMDIQMPIMDGLTATKLIRKLPKFTKEKLPIIAMTAHAMQIHKDQSIEAGMNDHLSKPIEPSRLRKKLLQWVTP